MIDSRNSVRAGALACLIVVCLAVGVRIKLTGTIDGIRAEQVRVAAEAEKLASLAPATGVGRPDYSVVVDDPEATVWVDLTWSADQTITDVVLVPSLHARAGQIVVADGFPGKIEIQTGEGVSTIAAARYSDKAAALPAPRFYSCLLYTSPSPRDS